MGLVFPRGRSSGVDDWLPNEKNEIRFCSELVDAMEVYGCFNSGIYYFIPRKYPMTGDPDEGYELGDC